MIDWGLVATGIVVGIAVAAPIGPVNLLCIRYSLAYGFWVGVFAGLGAVLGDGTFASIAAFSLTASANLLIDWAMPLQIVGSIFLVAMGLRIFFSDPDLTELKKTPPLKRYFVTFTTSYFLTITNPAVMMGFAAIFGGIDGLTKQTADYYAALTIVSAVMAGSLIWWLIISRIAVSFKARITENHLRITNRITGILILGFGGAVGVKLLIT